MTRESRERLADIAQAVGSIEEYVGGSLADPKVDDPLVLHAVLFNLIVIGEAAKNVDDEARATVDDVPWADYGGLRDVIAHQYFRVQREIVENTIRSALPKLAAAVEVLLS